MTDLEAITLTVVSTLVSGGASWFFSRMYYLKSLANKDAEVARELTSLKEALRARDAADGSLLRQQYIDAAVDAWKKKGTAVHYLESLAGLSKEEKSQILRSAALRHKGREPKNNPYAS